jgi:hypothetical protein
MKNSCDKTFTLTKSAITSSDALTLTKAHILQSALGVSLVRSVECGLFA